MFNLIEEFFIPLYIDLSTDAMGLDLFVYSLVPLSVISIIVCIIFGFNVAKTKEESARKKAMNKLMVAIIISVVITVLTVAIVGQSKVVILFNTMLTLFR